MPEPSERTPQSSPPRGGTAQAASTKTRTSTVVLALVGIAILGGLAFAILREGGPLSNTKVYTEDFEGYTNEELEESTVHDRRGIRTIGGTPIGEHSDSIRAQNGQLILETLGDPLVENTRLADSRNRSNAGGGSWHSGKFHVDLCSDEEEELIWDSRKAVYVTQDLNREVVGPDPENPWDVIETEVILPEHNTVLIPGDAEPFLKRVVAKLHDFDTDEVLFSSDTAGPGEYDAKAEFASSNPEVALVYPNGTILPISPGTTTITAHVCGGIGNNAVVVNVLDPDEVNGTELSWHPGEAIDTRFISGNIESLNFSGDLPEDEVIESVTVQLEINTTDYDFFGGEGENLFSKGIYHLYVSSNDGASWVKADGLMDSIEQLTPNENVVEVTVEIPEDLRGNDLRYALRMSHDETGARRVVRERTPASWPIVSRSSNSNVVRSEESKSLSWSLLPSLKMAHAGGGDDLPAGDINVFNRAEDLQRAGLEMHEVIGTLDLNRILRLDQLSDRLHPVLVDQPTRGIFTSVGTSTPIMSAFGLHIDPDLIVVREVDFAVIDDLEEQDPRILVTDTQNEQGGQMTLPLRMNAESNDVWPLIQDQPVEIISGQRPGFTELSHSGSYTYQIGDAQAGGFGTLPDVRVVTLPEPTVNVESIRLEAHLTPGEAVVWEGDDRKACLKERDEMRRRGASEDELPLCPGDDIAEGLEDDARIIYRGHDRVIIKWGYANEELEKSLIEKSESGKKLDFLELTYTPKGGPVGSKRAPAYYDDQDKETPFYAVLNGLEGGGMCDVNNDVQECGRGVYNYRITTNGLETDEFQFKTLNRLQTVMYYYELIFGDQLRSQGLDVTKVETLEDLQSVQESKPGLKGRIDGMKFFHDPKNIDPEAASNPMSLAGVKFAIMNDRKYEEHSQRLVVTQERLGTEKTTAHLYASVHDRIYPEDLNKVSDDEGLDYWVKQVDREDEHRIDLDGVALALLLSTEYQEYQSAIAVDEAKFHADYAYQTVLKRGGDEDGVNTLADKFKDAEERLKDMQLDLAISDEFKDRIATIDTDNGRSEAITELYESCFGRPADVEGVTYWESLPDLTSEDLRIRFCEEGEGQ